MTARAYPYKKNAILTIREYENSMGMPEEERVTYLDLRGGPHLKVGDDKAADGLPIIAGIKPDGRGNYELNEIETNMVLSIYGKRNFGRYFNMLCEPGSLIYISKEKAKS